MDHLIDDSDRLNPCPFCGSEAEIITLEGEDRNVDVSAHCVQCTSSACGAASGFIYPLMDDVADLLHERWNKRPAAPMAQTASADQALNARRYEAIRALAALSEDEQNDVLDHVPDDDFDTNSVLPEDFDKRSDELIAAFEKHNKPRLAS